MFGGLEPIAVLDPSYDKMLCYWPDPGAVSLSCIVLDLILDLLPDPAPCAPAKHAQPLTPSPINPSTLFAAVAPATLSEPGPQLVAVGTGRAGASGGPVPLAQRHRRLRDAR